VGDVSTADLLLETLRDATGSDNLAYHGTPTALTGGFWAEMIRFRLDEPLLDLDRELVARIIPDPVMGAWESAIQQSVAEQGFPTPAVRLSVALPNALGRYLIVMDAVDGQPPLTGLGIGAIAAQIPNLVRHLPDQLAAMAARLHALDAQPLAAELEALHTTIPTTTAGFVEVQIERAEAAGRRDVAAAGGRLLAGQPRSSTLVISHGDLHPFNLLVTPDGPVLIDWTVARVAHPGFTVGFTDLMLSNPPIALPAPGRAVLRPLGRMMSKRFRNTYRSLSAGTTAVVNDENLEWHRRVHAFRILCELAVWDAEDARPASGHPWLVVEAVAERMLGIAPR
jgi:aminoglycoside phosphotransferase (APT) family kinase protein